VKKSTAEAADTGPGFSRAGVFFSFGGVLPAFRASGNLAALL